MESSVIQLAYLGPGGPEFMLVMLVLLLLFGAKEAPRILRKFNDIINQIRNTAEGFKREVMYGDLHSEPHDDAAGDDEPGEDYGYEEDAGHDVLQRAQRDQLDGVGGDAMLVEVEERDPVTTGERPCDAHGLGDDRVRGGGAQVEGGEALEHVVGQPVGGGQGQTHFR